MLDLEPVLLCRKETFNCGRVMPFEDFECEELVVFPQVGNVLPQFFDVLHVEETLIPNVELSN